jgi:phosphoglycolate phosphatase-like HAD superfamily hydrolase
VKFLAIDLDALGDTRQLWEAWRDDAARRFRIDRVSLEAELQNWEHLLERFAEERAPVYFRPDAAVNSVLRTLHRDGVTVGVFTEAPETLARLALAHLGAARRVSEVESGPGALERLRARLGDDARVVRTREELVSLR